MEKLDGKTMDIVAENVGKLKELFPEAFTEGKVDFEALKEVLGTFVDDRDERYSFTWNGKSKARMIAQTPSSGTLRPCKEESVDWDTTQNIFIEGDNLEVLKLLQKSYHKKVKMIYIDPPYNTGKDFVYKDNFKDNIKNYKEITGQVDGEGRNLSNNPETSGRYHTNWLNMMYPRLKLARNLLKDDGVIFISIDDNEVSNLRKMCDEVFGEENFIACFIWEKKYTTSNNIAGVSATHEYIVCYGKNNANLSDSISRLDYTDEARARYSNPDNDHRGDWMDVSYHGPKTPAERPNLNYPIIHPKTGEEIWPTEKSWAYEKNSYKKHVDENRLWWGKDLTYKEPRLKKFISEMAGGMVPKSILRNKDVGGTSVGRDNLRKIFEHKSGAIFDNPKPTSLVEHLVNIGAKEACIVLDFFAGSGTTANALFNKNLENKKKIKFISIQMPELTDERSEASKAGFKNIADLSKERIRRSAAKIKEENPEYNGDLGFKVFKLDSTNIKPWEVDFDLTESTLEDFISNIKTDRREEDVLYEILLKYGLDLTLPISERTIAGKKVFDIGMGALIICLADSISLEVVEGIAKLKDELNPEIMRVVFKDSGFKDDVVKTNAVQILKQAGIVDVRSL